MFSSNSINYSQNNEDLQVIIPGGPPTAFVTIPEYITVHLGRPDEIAENFNLSFIDYIKNVASSELYPTWPENALRANIYAIVSVALNRYILQSYRSRGYEFDITNSTQLDQAFVQGRGIYDNIDRITNEIFNDYVIRDGQVIPLFTTFCDGRITKCNGLYQWGTVDLAEQGFNPMEILKYYYGENISLVENAPVGGVGLTYPGEPLMPGDSSIIILRQQLGLNRIAMNFPAIPEIIPTDGYYGESTENAVREFQRVFNLPVTGIIDKATFYKIRQIYVAVSKLSELAVTGSIYEQIIEITREALLLGDIRPSVDMLQYLLDVLSSYYQTIPSVAYTGIFDEQTRDAVIEFQKIMGLPITGIVDDDTLDLLIRTGLGIFKTLPPQEVYLPLIRFPGIPYRKDQGIERPGILVIQEMLSYISLVIPTIPPITTDGVFGEEIERAVIAFQQMFGLEPTGIVDEATWNELQTVYRQQRYGGLQPTL
jgi:peptidoglycan hydrolase-like protein with peptidoglycan-binding domain